MARAKVAISLDKQTLSRLDRLVRAHIFPSRSQAIQQAVEEKLSRLEHARLARECSKLDPAFEKALAEEGMSERLAEAWDREIEEDARAGKLDRLASRALKAFESGSCTEL